MNFERIGILIISIILTVMLSVKYVKRYNPINLFVIPVMAFLDSIYTYLTIYNVYVEWYIDFILYIFTIIIPLFLVLLQYNNIILKRQILYYTMKCLFKAKEYDKTIVYINKLVNLEGRNNEYMYILGRCYKSKNDYINARDCFALAIELNPKDYLSCYEFGLILDETNKKEVACAMFNKALKINPNFYEAAEALGISLTSQGNFKKAIYIYRKIIKKFPRSYELYYNIGMLEMELGNYEKAIESFTCCADIKPDLFMAHYNIGKLEFILKRYDNAISSYKKIVYSPVYGPKAYYKMAIIFAIKEEYEKAMANLEYAIELDDNFIKEASKEASFNKIRKQINDFCEAREKLIEKKKEKNNFISNKFSLFKKNEDIKVKIGI